MSEINRYAYIEYVEESATGAIRCIVRAH